MIMIYNQKNCGTKARKIYINETASAQSFIIILLESIFGAMGRRKAQIVQISDDQHKNCAPSSFTDLCSVDEIIIK